MAMSHMQELDCDWVLGRDALKLTAMAFARKRAKGQSGVSGQLDVIKTICYVSNPVPSINGSKKK